MAFWYERFVKLEKHYDEHYIIQLHIDICTYMYDLSIAGINNNNLREKTTRAIDVTDIVS